METRKGTSHWPDSAISLARESIPLHFISVYTAFQRVLFGVHDILNFGT
jgi:hypothetical protein